MTLPVRKVVPGQFQPAINSLVNHLPRVDVVTQRDNALHTPAIDAHDRGILLAKTNITGPRYCMESHAQADEELKRLDDLRVFG